MGSAKGKKARKSRPSTMATERSDFRTSPEWKQHRVDMLDLHNSTCNFCQINHSKNTRKLQVHHRSMLKSEYTNLDDMSRFSLLCSNCHKTVHQMYIRVNSKKSPSNDEDMIRIVNRFFIL